MAQHALGSDAGQILTAEHMPDYLTPTGLSVATVTRSDKLRKFRAALANRENALCTIVTIGDSITEGQGATSETKRWATQLRRILQRGFPGSSGRWGANYLPATYMLNSFPQVATTGGVVTSNSNFGPGGRSLRLDPSGASVTWTVTGTSVDVLYAKNSAAGSMEVLIDGVSQGTINTAQATPGSDGWVAHYALPNTSTSHTVTVRSAGAQYVFVEGIIVYNGDETSGVRHIDAGHWGWATSNFALGGSNGTSLSETMATLAPALVTLALGANDMSTNTDPAVFQANVASIIAKIRANGADPDVLLLAFPERKDGPFTYPWAQYTAAMQAVADADSRVAFLDLGQMMSTVATDTLGLWSDHVHPTDKGHAAIAEYIAGYLLAGMHPQPRTDFVEASSIFVPIQQMTPIAGTPAIVVGSGTYTFLAYDQATQESANATVVLPTSWKAINVELFHGKVAGTAGDAVMRVQLGQVPNGALRDGNLFDVTKTLTGVGTSTLWGVSRTTFASNVAVDPTKPFSILQVIRMAASGSDTLDGDYGVAGVLITRAA